MKVLPIFLICVVKVAVGNVAVAPLITMGQEAMPGQFPWFAYIQGHNVYNDYIMECGGSLVSSKYVLTIASCLINVTDVQVLLGSHMMGNQFQYSNYQVSNLIIPHWNYVEGSSNYDAALIRLPISVLSTTYIKPILLSSTDYSETSAEVYIMGAGLKHASYYYDGILRWTKAKTITNSKCSETFGANITSAVICAEGFDNPWQSACYGDEGSPVVLKEDGIWKQIGIISFVSQIGCGLDLPFGNTRASAIKSWVSAITGAI